MRFPPPPTPDVASRFEVAFGALLTQLTAEFVADCAAGAPAFDDLPRLAAVDPGELDGAGRVDLIRAWERARTMIEGLQQSALAAVVEATEGLGLDADAARHEVGAALRLSPGTAWDRTRGGHRPGAPAARHAG